MNLIHIDISTKLAGFNATPVYHQTAQVSMGADEARLIALVGFLAIVGVWLL